MTLADAAEFCLAQQAIPAFSVGRRDKLLHQASQRCLPSFLGGQRLIVLQSTPPFNAKSSYLSGPKIAVNGMYLKAEHERQYEASPLELFHTICSALPGTESY